MRGSSLQPGRSATLAVGEGLELGSIPFLLQVRRGHLTDPRQSAVVEVEGPQSTPPRLATVGPRMAGVLTLAERVAAGDINVLVLGETGAGKEVMAERIHAASPRAARPFVGLNCASFPENLLESELFGHERGAFTGAVSTKPGLLETGDGGSVFLDEIGEMPQALQAKLLRVIDERRVLRLGGLAPRPIDVRFIAATNRDLSIEIARGRFRRDLYFRLAGVTLDIPPLRERNEEIRELAGLFASKAAARLGLQRAPRIDAGALARLHDHTWPGNVRELRNVIERAILVCQGDTVGADHLHFDAVSIGEEEAESSAREGEHPTPRPGTLSPASFGAPAASGPLKEQMLELERSRILGALEECAGNQTRAARMLGMPRATFVKRLDAMGVPRPRKR